MSQKHGNEPYNADISWKKHLTVACRALVQLKKVNRAKTESFFIRFWYGFGTVPNSLFAVYDFLTGLLSEEA